MQLYICIQHELKPTDTQYVEFNCIYSFYIGEIDNIFIGTQKIYLSVELPYDIPRKYV